MRLDPILLPQFGEQYDPFKARSLVEELERLYQSLRAHTDDPEQVSAADLADETSVINTTDKRLGKPVIDTTNDRMLYALGPGVNDGWRVVDGSSTVTPA
jgi:hypothetical protein